MGTTMRIRGVVLAAVLSVAGCGADGAGLGDDGTGGAASVPGTGGTIGAGGQGGVAPAGSGGTPVPTGGTIGTTFTRADHDMCMNWPVCPSDIVAPLPDTGRVFSAECTMAFDGTRLSCAACLRLSNADLFVGRCLAPFITFGNGNFVTSQLSPADRRRAADPAAPVLAGGWALCTGDKASYTTADGRPIMRVDGDDYLHVDGRALTDEESRTYQAGVNATTVCKD